jgi:murein tripeptide amidase MpaA
LPVRFDAYLGYDALTKALVDLAAAHPELAQLDSVGKSHEGRDLWLVTITNTATGPDLEKPAFWLDGNIHSVELAASMACLYTINELLTRYGSDDQVTRLVDRMAFYILPRLNPDGVELALGKPPRYIRSGVRPYPFADEDSGLEPGDVDGDGRVLTMRLEDPTGPWRASEKDPRAMIRRGPDEEGGTYYRLFPEGRVKDYDGWLIRLARPRQGLDFNRNFPAIWEGEGSQKGAGPYPLSEEETRAVARFITEHPNLTGAITYHTSGGIHLRPLSFKADDDLPVEDLWVYRLIGRRATELTGYQAVSLYHDFRYHPKEIMTGAFDDWMYDTLGIWAWTTELWDVVGRATGKTDRRQIDWYRDHPEEDDLAILRWDDEHNGGHGFVPWYAVDHPDLGKVELGGWDRLYSWTNPPPALLEEEIAKNHRFALAQASMAPRLEVLEAAVEPLGGDRYKIRLVIQNAGFLGTYVSRKAEERKMARPIRIELEGAEVVVGERGQEVGQLEGRSNKLDWTSNSATDNRLRREWVVSGKPGSELVIHVRSERAGTLHVKLELKPG